MDLSLPAPTAVAWWRPRQHWYNVALTVAGMTAFLCYAGTLVFRCSHVPGADITLVTILFDGFLYLCAMGLANLCYQLGPFCERFIAREALRSYRKWAFTTGLTFSVLLPFAPPLLALTMGCGPGENMTPN